MKSLLAATSIKAMVACSLAASAMIPFAVAQAQTRDYRVEFALGSAQLDSQARQVVRRAADAFRSGDSATIRLVGHADTTGNADLNLRLSERRAEAVINALENEGVSPQSIQMDAVGENALVVPTADGVALQANRVVTITIKEPQQAAAPVLTPEPAPAPQHVMEKKPVDQFQNFAIDLGPYYGYDFESDKNLIGANLSVDFRINKYVSIGAEQAGFWVVEDGFGGRSVGSLDFSVGSLANLGQFGQVIPYLGVNAGYVYGDEIKNSFIYGPEIGIDIGFVTAKVSYDMRDEGVEDGTISATVGGLIRF